MVGDKVVLVPYCPEHVEKFVTTLVLRSRDNWQVPRVDAERGIARADRLGAVIPRGRI